MHAAAAAPPRPARGRSTRQPRRRRKATPEERERTEALDIPEERGAASVSLRASLLLLGVHGVHQRLPDDGEEDGGHAVAEDLGHEAAPEQSAEAVALDDKVRRLEVPARLFPWRPSAVAGRGGAAATTWTFRGGDGRNSRRRRGTRRAPPPSGPPSSRRGSSSSSSRRPGRFRTLEASRRKAPARRARVRRRAAGQEQRARPTRANAS